MNIITAVDYIIRGDAEIALPRLLNSLIQGQEFQYVPKAMDSTFTVPNDRFKKLLKQLPFLKPLKNCIKIQHMMLDGRTMMGFCCYGNQGISSLWFLIIHAMPICGLKNASEVGSITQIMKVRI
ncbi:MAG: hypothetical protein E6230_17185 [Paenibacillus dendritiformis]|uniref:hypothetical protein n=1 Tax=uncultured Paenibacillus sp. TaxID=227322 RepID=UPI0025FCFE06|nr:hypothetical protein [uncultured Paenibacillus sp.]MDU5143904.1 hypothetical protein [Paenibacillus dendritiformis]